MGLVPQFYKGAYGGMVTVDGIEAGKTPVAQLCGHVGLVFQNPFNQLSGARITYTRKWHLACRIWVCRQKK